MEPLTAFELAERDLITFVIAHTGTLEIAAIMLNMTTTTLKSRREKYDIPTPASPYTGPRLSHEEMFRAYRESLRPDTPPSTVEYAQGLLKAAQVTFSLPTGQAKTFPLAQLLPTPPHLR